MRPEKSEKKEFVLPAKSTVQHAESGNSILFESGGEFVLPDYMPKMQKVLRLETRALAPAQYISGNEAQMSGGVLHTLLYLGEDGEFSATVLPSKYEFTVPLPVSAEPPEFSAGVEVDTLSYRISAPRKINIRAKLRAKPRTYVAEDVSATCVPSENADGLHRLCGEFDSVRTTLLSTQDMELSDMIDVDGTDVRPIWCGATAAVSDVRPTENGISVRGDAYVKVLVLSDGTPKMLTKKIPFETFMDAEVQKGTQATATASVISTEAGKEQNSNSITVEVLLGISGRTDEPRRVNAVRDVFSEVSDGNVEYRQTQTERLLYNRCGVFNIGGSTAKTSAGAADAVLILDTSGEASVDEVTAADGRITVNGRLALNSIYFNEDGNQSAGEYTVPFRITVDSETPNGTTAEATATLANVRARIDGDNIAVDADMFVCIRASERGEIATVSIADYTQAKAFEKGNHPLCLIYPKGDSLWTLAKKYRVSPESLARVNGLLIDERDYASPTALANAHTLLLELKS